MDTETIGAALKRKLGPLPVWIWAILGGVVVYYLRSKGYFQGVLGSNDVNQGETLQPRQAAATTPQAQTTLQPGESVYDPNTGALTTAPGGGAVGDGGGVDQSQGMEDLADAIRNGLTTTIRVDSRSPRTAKSAAKAKKADTAAKGKARKTHAAAVRAAKKRKAHAQAPGHKGTTKKAAPAHKTKARSSASIGHDTGRTNNHKPGARSASKPRHPVAAAKSTTRQRPTHGLVRKTAPNAHPAATHPTPKPATHHAPPPRPSAPAARTVRAPARKAPAPRPAKRH